MGIRGIFVYRSAMEIYLLICLFQNYIISLQRETKNKGIMKKIIYLFILVSFASCKQSNFPFVDQGGKNAMQYLREKTISVSSEIDKMEVTGVDSLLCDRALVLNSVAFAKAGADFWEGKISRDEYQKIIDKFSQTATDIAYSWQFSTVINDSLCKLDKYQYDWRKVYEITTTMKSTVTKTTRVLMDQDGITPRMTEKEFTDKINEWTDKIVEAQRDIYRR